jgi:serine/threonine protein kinase/tetratricopeptide (TPR) repeat protein
VGVDAGDGSGSPPGVRPGALTDLLRQVAEAPGAQVAEPAPLLPGAVVGRFEILRELGRGGFGVVYEARDRELGRQVALKFVRAGLAGADEGRVAREAEAIARLSHPNLITLHDVGRSDGSPYLVFELLRGKTLQERLDEGPLALQEAVHVAVEVARGLAHAHAEGVVHRDLKPSNVFITSKGQVKILDFGLAHAFGRRRLSGGTPAYMAPEQWNDDPEDERTDLFALGVMLHVMLSGEFPFPEADGRWSAGPAPAPRLELPGAPGLADLLDRLLEKTPKGRPRDGGAALAALTPIEEALRSKPADVAPPSHARQRKAPLGERLSSPGGRRLLGWMAAVGLGALLAVGAGLLWTTVPGKQVASSLEVRPSIAVLPFADLSEKHDQEYFADGVAEEILNALASLHGLRVTGRTSSFSFKGSKDDLGAIGRKLGVATLLEGSVRRAGKRARVTAKLVNVADGFTLWTETYDKELTDLFGVQEQIARAVVAALKLKLAVGEAPSVATHRTRRPEVYDAYLVARRLLKQGPEGWVAAVPAYERTLALDPGYGPAWAELAEALYWASEMTMGSARAQLRDRALPAAERGVALAPELATAWSTRGFLRTLLRWDFEGGRQDFTQALALSGGDARVLRDYGTVILPPLGRLDEGIAALVRSTELDPLDDMAWFFLTYTYAGKGDWERASRAGARALQVEPANPYAAYWLSVVPLVQGRADEALTVASKNRHPAFGLVTAAMAYHSLGDRRRSDQLIEKLEAGEFADTAPYQLAEVRAWRGEHDKAFAWLERARVKYDSGLVELRHDPLLRSLRGDPRYAALLRKLNLPPD